ncbi:MAG: site-specific DNA-methyltransferase [Planctomycetota bacterium]|nr:MAG: site-specific DNA-methyltransferase [Planctomycetota bacterium]REK31357.1 MAG: site-specific DNA-methyltransferase [Planctomycetota bacterium]REK39082.1 MAG: site-specific DNA-methyltransferase [Planctomycetota bacterium]
MGLRKNQIHQGDCVASLKRVDEGSVDLVFADPPFNIGYEYDVYDDSQAAEDYLAWSRQWIRGVYRALKPNGTFWLAIGDEFAAELKIEAQQAGFHCRSWVIWYYTFGVNCVNGFSRSHTHLFHFVKDPSDFTFNRVNPQVRVKSARELVYGDNRANPNGRLPDNTWITRPQDAPFFLSFNPSHDTWYFARVAGTFKEREGFHGCQMPEQLLARIIRVSSRPQDLVLDPFGGSGTTLAVAKKLGRQWMGFELSKEYVKYIQERLDKTNAGDPIDGPDDPIQSAPTTATGRRNKRPFNEDTQKAVVAAYRQAGRGYPADYILCDEDLNAEFVRACRDRGIGGSPFLWNRYLLRMRKANRLPQASKRPPRVTAEEMDRFGFASEVAWRLLAIDYRKTLDDILCSPEFAREFDRLAAEFGPKDIPVSSFEYRRAALSIRKRSKAARSKATKNFSPWMSRNKELPRTSIDALEQLEKPGVFVLNAGDVGFYAGESQNMRNRVEQALDHERWQGLEPDSVAFVENDGSLAAKYALKSALARRGECPLLNCRLLVHDSELP